jgi:thiosulfate dehydrogenase [quinone] large subunit
VSNTRHMVFLRRWPTSWLLRQINADRGQLTDQALFRNRSLGLHRRKEQGMTTATTERSFILVFRLLMAWTFLYAASHQIFNPKFSAAAFLSQTKTFHNIYAVFTAPAIDPVLTFLVSYGHLLIGLSLLFGLMVRVSAAFGVALLLIYWTAHMDWPFIENTNNFIIDYHIVYATMCVYLIVERAGHVWGLDAWAEKLPVFQQHSSLRPLVA